MNQYKKLIICAAAMLSLPFYRADAQELKLKIPAASLHQRIEQDFGLGTISVSYYRPNTKGRKIFGQTEPYGTVWRTGANNATVISFTDTVSLEGHVVSPGDYALLSIPGENEWTIILNKDAKQWGAYAYNEKQDVLRFKVKPLHMPAKTETLAIQFVDVRLDEAVLQILWENTAVNMRLQTNVDQRIMANIQQAMQGERKPYYMSAIWYYNHGKDLKQALAWMQEADKAQPQAFNIKYWLARLQLSNGDKTAAIATAKEALKLAEAEQSGEYVRLSNAVLHDAGVPAGR